MKKSLLLLSFMALGITGTNAQVKNQEISKEAADVTDQSVYNKWTVEANVGMSKGSNPYTEGYFSSNPDKILGDLVINNYGLCARYMFSPKFGLKLDGQYELLEDNPDTKSKDFKVQQIRLNLQGVINASRLLNIEEPMGRMGILIHAGVQWARITPQAYPGSEFEDPIGGPSNVGHTENNLGVLFGITPQVRIAKKLALMLDLTMLSNFRQHFAWDGHYSKADNNLAGSLISSSLGLSYSFGQGELHGDWAIIEDKRSADLDELDKRVGDLETMLDDSDKDGVPDYLDVENNSIAGVAVDTKGRMVDINKNGVPDELEKFLADTYVDKPTLASQGNAEMIKKLINDGYVTTYFDFNKTKPTNVSTEGIDFILTYMRNNPTASVDILGNADEVGKTDYNIKLANDRANTVKNTLIKAGISPSRLNIISKGEDTTVDPNSSDARRLVRRVTFRVK